VPWNLNSARGSFVRSIASLAGEPPVPTVVSDATARGSASAEPVSSVEVSHITEISKPTQWKPGQSGNLNGRPVGTRQAFSAGFHRDLAEIWAKHGRETMIKTALGSSFTAP